MSYWSAQILDNNGLQVVPFVNVENFVVQNANFNEGHIELTVTGKYEDLAYFSTHMWTSVRTIHTVIIKNSFEDSAQHYFENCWLQNLTMSDWGDLEIKIDMVWYIQNYVVPNYQHHHIDRGDLYYQIYGDNSSEFVVSLFKNNENESCKCNWIQCGF